VARQTEAQPDVRGAALAGVRGDALETAATPEVAVALGVRRWGAAAPATDVEEDGGEQEREQSEGDQRRGGE
jgi:hypothetical protein